MVIVATWVAGEIAESQERDTVDTRLAANLRFGREEFRDTLEDARLEAERIAASPDVQRALAERTRTRRDGSSRPKETSGSSPRVGFSRAMTPGRRAGPRT